ncbi:diaminopropionate ammonia-lyase [Halobacteroides halobius DSM 5150]|uniref:Diaminopropionate ammonia-lyase n=1 Tax=Halobacteroides halobius (strain ATCC 35273 / DSM 5150 / MD-1) TaxID=748449 RepID=L0K8X8_HALHC|nr:diaminopropionate ammonia-lyase [Halobacteroides halobius]AGB41000.1 diaminopropionate ammonia-lyase [Halobacteroides halobius DSM 5150]
MLNIEEPVKLQFLSNDGLGGLTPDFLDQEQVKQVKRFHSTFADYKATPLVSLDNLAAKLNVKKIYIKDEAYRFGLDAFKVLGGAYAIAKLLCKKLGVELDEIDFNYLKSKEVKEEIGDVTFVTATDGNHGRGVAWAASQLGYQAIVYLPKGSAKRRVEAIRETGAKAVVTDANYDKTVSYAINKAEIEDWLIVQDTAWEGYEEIPSWIMQGYTTMADEALLQMELDGIDKPTHLFLQAGVGSMAGSVLGYYANYYDGKPPITTIVEPNDAACIFKSAFVGDGLAHNVDSDLKTDMAGLACGEPNPIAWQILRDFSKMNVKCDDSVAATGMRMLANPLGNDPRVIAGESGAVGLGLLTLLMNDSKLNEVREELDLNEDSVVLLFNTEGATDPINYQRIIWGGKGSLALNL